MLFSGDLDLMSWVATGPYPCARRQRGQLTGAHWPAGLAKLSFQVSGKTSALQIKGKDKDTLTSASGLHTAAYVQTQSHTINTHTQTCTTHTFTHTIHTFTHHTDTFTHHTHTHSHTHSHTFTQHTHTFIHTHKERKNYLVLNI